MNLSDWGPSVPQEVKDKFTKTVADLDAGTIVAFKGPIKDQSGNVVVKAGEVLTDDVMGNVNWFVLGMVGSPK